MKIFETKAALVAATLTAGQLVQIKGETTAGLKAGTYLVKTAAEIPSPNGTTQFAIANGNVVELLDVEQRTTTSTGTQTLSAALDDRLPAFNMDAHISAGGSIASGLTAANGRLVVFPLSGSPYTSSTKIDLTSVDVNVVCEEGVEIDCSGLPTGTALGEQYFLSAAGTVADSSLLTVDADAYSTDRTNADPESTATVADGTKFTAGDLCVLRSNQLFDDAWTGSSANKRGEMVKVKSVAGNVVTFADRLRFSYAVASSAILEKMTPISFEWKGGKLIGGGVGEGHSAFQISIAENPEVDVRCDYFEDTGIQLSRVYKGDVNVRPNYCTSSATLGNTGYGVAINEASRYIKAHAVGEKCRHIVTGGGSLPALDAVVTGMAVDCGIGTHAWDCHEPCFGWKFDVKSRGGVGGAVIRGSDIKIDLDTADCLGGLRIKTFNTVTVQKDIHFNLKARGVKGQALVADAENSPIKNLTFDSIDIDDARLDGTSLLGDIDGFRGALAIIKDTWLRSGEVASSGRGIFTNGEAYTVGERVKNIIIGELVTRETLKEGGEFTFTDGVSIGVVDCVAQNGAAMRITDSDNIDLPKGTLEAIAATAPLATTRVDSISVGARLLGDVANGAVDGWRGVDTTNAMLNGSPKVAAGRHGAFFSGTSENIIFTNNNLTDVVGSNKLNEGTALNVVEANNLT